MSMEKQLESLAQLVDGEPDTQLVWTPLHAFSAKNSLLSIPVTSQLQYTGFMLLSRDQLSAGNILIVYFCL